MTESPWTLDQLAERVGAALSVDYDGQASGRVREVPDQRAIRYYTTVGLVDRPAAMRGRTALYARRHLLQLVAIKRLQASGLSLARIQRELAGATDAQLEAVARVPALDEPAASPVPAAASPTPVLAVPRRAFWKRPAQAAPLEAASAEPAPAPPPGFKSAGLEGTATHAAPPRHGMASLSEAAVAPGRPAPEPTAPSRATPAPPDATAVPEAAAAGEATVVAMQGVRLGDGVTLLVEGGRPLGAGEVAAIRAAAGPLLDALRRGRERS